MTQDDDFRLLAELADVVSRYNPDSLSRLAQLIRDPGRAADLATVLETVVAKGSRAKKSKGQRARDRLGMGILKEVRDTDPERHPAIAGFRHDLLSHTILTSMDDLRQFARANDLSIGRASSRNAAIAPLLRSLSKLPASRIRDLREALVESETRDRSLESWRHLIVRPRSGGPPRTNE